MRRSVQAGRWEGDRVAQAYQLVIDLGTCHTVAVVRRAGEAPRPLLFDGSPLLPSGVYRGEDGSLVVGRDAERLAATAPSRYEPYPKRTVDDGSVLLGDGSVAVVDLLAAILRRVMVEAAAQGADAGQITLTCPADWGPRRREVLTGAAYAAGMPQVRLVDEPIAAATYCAEVLGQQIPAGRCLLVFDFGGGTLDVTVVRREPQGLRVLAVGGLDDLGGVDVDAALVGHLGQLVSLRTPALWQRLMRPQGTGDMRDRKTFWDNVRGAKEMLSRSSSAPIPLPGSDDAVHLTREELERVAGPLVDRAVDETRRVLERAGVPTGSLAGILLVGGSSRIPLVASRLHARFGIAPTVPEQPELPVAYGGLLVEGVPAPVVDTPTAAQPMVARPVGAPPVGAPPLGTPPIYPPPPMPWTPPAPPPALPPPARRPGRVAALVSMIAVAIVVLSLGGVYGIRALARATTGTTSGQTGNGLNGGSHGGGGTAGGGGGGGTLKLVNGFPMSLGADAVAGVAVGNGAAYYAVVTGDHTELHAVGLPGGKAPSWQVVRVPIQPSGLVMTVVGDLLVIDGKESASDNGEDTRAVVNVATGKWLWKGKWRTTDSTDLAYIGTDVIVARQFDVQTQRVSLLTGKTVWTHDPPSSVAIAYKHAESPLMWQPSTGASALPLPRSGGGGFQESLVPDATKVVQVYSDDGKAEVLDAGSGRKVAGGSVAVDDNPIDDMWTAFDGLLIGAAKDGAPRLLSYQLNSFKPGWTYPLPPGASVKLVKGCGKHRVCVKSVVQSRYEVMAVDTQTGHALWSKPLTSDFGNETGWYVLDQKMVFGYKVFDSVGSRDVPVGLPDDKGNVTNLADAETTMNAADGRYVVLAKPQLSGSTVNDTVSIVDLETGKRTGWLSVGHLDGQPVIAVTGVTVAVVFGGQLYLAQAHL